MPTKKIELTHWAMLRTRDGRTRESGYRSEQQAKREAADTVDAMARGAAWAEDITDVRLDRVTNTYRVGDEVEVHAYGRTRSGTVTKLGRTRVTVRFYRNRQGDQDERAFTSIEVWPLDSAAQVRERVLWPWV